MSTRGAPCLRPREQVTSTNSAIVCGVDKVKTVGARDADTNHTRIAVPEPPPKRKTLAERAGEPLHPPRSHAGHLPKPKSTSQNHHRTGSTLTQAYRNPSNASTASSTSSVRPPSKQNGQRAIGHRPPSVAESIIAPDEDVEEDAGVMGKRKGTPPILSFNPANTIALHKRRGNYDLRNQSRTISADSSTGSQHSSSYARSNSASSDGSTQAQHDSRHTPATSVSQQAVCAMGLPDARNVSLCTSFADLSLTPKPRKTSGPKSTKHTPSLEGIREELSPSKIPKFSCTPALRHAQSTQALTTPTPMRHKSSINGLRTPVTVSRRRDEIPVFLTKDKLTPTPAWDTKGRLEDMEQLYAHLRGQFASAADSKSALEESLTLYKSRGTQQLNTTSLSDD